jgi:hypothetical protein
LGTGLSSERENPLADAQKHLISQEKYLAPASRDSFPTNGPRCTRGRLVGSGWSKRRKPARRPVKGKQTGPRTEKGARRRRIGAIPRPGAHRSWEWNAAAFACGRCWHPPQSMV